MSRRFRIALVPALLVATILSCAAQDDVPDPLPGALPARLVGGSDLGGAPALCVALRGPLAFVGCGAQGVKIVDVSRPEAPEIVATVDAVADRIAVSGDSLFVADLPSGLRSEATLSVFDVLDPRAAELLKTVRFDAESSGDLAADGRFVALAGGSRGALVADSRHLAFAARPAPAGTERAIGALVQKGVLFGIFGPGGSWFASARGTAVLEAASLDRNAVLSTTPLCDLRARPAAIDGRDGPPECGLALDGDRLLVVAGGELRVLDASNPRALALLGSVAIDGAFRVAVDGPLAACATGDLVLVDLANPARPRALATIPTPGSVLDLAVRGRHVFVAADGGGLRVYGITDGESAP